MLHTARSIRSPLIDACRYPVTIRLAVMVLSYHWDLDSELYLSLSLTALYARTLFIIMQVNYSWPSSFELPNFNEQLDYNN